MLFQNHSKTRESKIFLIDFFDSSQNGKQKRPQTPGGAGVLHYLPVFVLFDFLLCPTSKVVTSMLRVDDGAPVEVTVFQTVDQDFGSGNVGGNRNVVDIADAQQVHLIGLIGLGADGVAEEEQHVHLFTGDARYDLLGAAMAAGEKIL